MTTPATKSKRKRTTDEAAAGSSASQEKKARLRAPHFSAPTEMVTFLVGKPGSEEPFLVHKVLRVAFNGQTQTYRLEDISTNAFRLFVQWIYSQKISIRGSIDSVSDNSVQSVAGAGKNGSNKPGNELEEDQEDEEEEAPTELKEVWRAQDLDLAQLWVAGDRLFIPGLQNAVILTWDKLWYSNDGRRCSTSWFNYAYEHTCVGSHLRNLAVDQLAYSVNPNVIKKRAEELPREMLIDLTLVYSEAIWPIDPEDDVFRRSGRASIWKRPGNISKTGYQFERFQCTRTWRDYLVPEDED